MLGLRFCARAFSSCGKWGPLLIAVRGPLTIAASLVAEHRLQTRRLSSCGSWAQLLRGMWDPPRPGLEPASPALAGRFSTTGPPGKPQGRGSFGKNFTRILCLAGALFQTAEALPSFSWNRARDAPRRHDLDGQRVLSSFSQKGLSWDPEGGRRQERMGDHSR